MIQSCSKRANVGVCIANVCCNICTCITLTSKLTREHFSSKTFILDTHLAGHCLKDRTCLPATKWAPLTGNATIAT